MDFRERRVLSVKLAESMAIPNEQHPRAHQVALSAPRPRPRRVRRRPPRAPVTTYTSPTRWAHRRRRATDGLFRKSVLLTALPGTYNLFT